MIAVFTILGRVGITLLNIGLAMGLTFGALILLRPVTGRLLRPRHQVWLWFVGWYDLRICGGSYNTIVTDALLSAAFFAAFFLPLLPGCPRKAAAVTALSLLALAAAFFFALQP